MAVDRYPTDPLDGPAALAEVLREINRRLDELEASRPLGDTTLKNGTLKVVDENGDLRVQLGSLTANGGDGTNWGLEVMSQPGSSDWPDGLPFFRVDENGVIFPYVSSPVMNEDGGYETETSATFVTSFSGGIGIVMHKKVSCLVWVQSDASTTGEVRLTLRGGASTAPVTIGPSANIYVSIDAWEHGQDLWTGPCIIDLETRRTSGAGNIYVHPPVLGFVFQP